MAVAERQAEKEAEKKKVEKVEAAGGDDRPERSDSRPGGIGGALAWPGRKLGEGRAFFSEVRAELKKVTWPSRKEVYSTTIVVVVTSVMFGFYLWGLDLVFSRVMSVVLGGGAR